MVDAPARRDDAVVQELREAGLRVTMARQAVLTWLTSHPHSTADAITRRNGSDRSTRQADDDRRRCAGRERRAFAHRRPRRPDSAPGPLPNRADGQLQP